MTEEKRLSQTDQRLREDLYRIVDNAQMSAWKKGMTTDIDFYVDQILSLISQEKKKYGEEIIGSILKDLYEMPLYVVDNRMSSEKPHEYRHAVDYEKVKEIIELRQKNEEES